jgi:hypothetical protein
LSSIFRATQPADQARLIEFLQRVFALPANAPMLEPRLLHWKYWTPRDDIETPRSWMLEKEGRLVAHVGLWPARTGVETGVHMIDWASDSQAPGAGVSVLQRLTKAHDFVYSIGGSEATQAILPKFGFANTGKATYWARPLRPLRQMWRHPQRDWRLPARAGRNFIWSIRPARRLPAGWDAVPGELDGLNAFGEGGRPAAFFAYLRKCPSMRAWHGFTIRRAGRPAGFFVLAVAGEQVRLAGVWLAEKTPESWRAAFLLAQQAARIHTGAAEFVARTAAPVAAEGAAAAGLRARGGHPVFLYRKRRDASDWPLEFQLADNDEVFLESGFLT